MSLPNGDSRGIRFASMPEVHMIQHVPGRLRRYVSALLLLGYGCAAPIDETGDGVSNEDEAVAVSAQAITNGWVASNEEHLGVIAIQAWSSTSNRYWTACSGSLMSNRVVLTAKHCVTDLGNQTLYAKMGSQRATVTQFALHPNWDVAVLRISPSMRMPNWRTDRYQTNPYQINTTGYRRSIYTGTNASLDGNVLMCYGHGGTAWEPPLTYGWFNTTFGSDGYNPQDEVHLWETNSMLPEPGDSGMGCTYGIWFYQSPVAVVQSGCFFGSGFCYGAGAADWGPWAAIYIAFW
jgi:hypothetical protein